MAFSTYSHIRITGISACAPKQVVDNELVYSKWGGYDNFLLSTGIAHHHNTSKDICASDLCVEAVEKLLFELKWNKSEIDAIVFVSQTPDYNCVPATSNILQYRLGLSNDCLALDIALGCSGWIYGLNVLSALMQNGTIKRGLLLAGDTPSKFCSEQDKSTYPLFGDAGTATALEYDPQCEQELQFVMKSDGSGSQVIMIKDGGYRNRITPNSFRKSEYGDGIIRDDTELLLDGMSVFSFGISKAPQIVNELIDHYAIEKDSIDLFTFHQANMFMNEKIRKKLKLPVEKVPYSLQDFGNTSCASIPLTLVSQCGKRLQNEHLRHIACGFGVGLSWGAVCFDTNKIIVPDLILI